MPTAVHHFEKTGINPFNPDVFPDYLFAPANVTEIDYIQKNISPSDSSPSIDKTVEKNIPLSIICNLEKQNTHQVASPLTSSSSQFVASPSRPHYVSVADISPVPRATSQSTKRNTKRKSTIGIKQYS